MSISHKRLRVVKGGRNRKERPKTFKDEETAKKHAESKGIKKYKLVDLKEGKKEKKFRIMPE